MASETDIANRALQKLGANRISNFSEDSRNARSISAAYTPLRLLELRMHPWNFAIKRASIAKTTLSETEQDLVPRYNKFRLPSDFLRLMPRDPGGNLGSYDWQIENGQVLTSYDSPLLIRYIADIENVNSMDALFREALSARIAMELAEEITQSNTKKDFLQQSYDRIVNMAKKTNAIENVAFMPEEDTWVTGRNVGTIVPGSGYSY